MLSDPQTEKVDKQLIKTLSLITRIPDNTEEEIRTILAETDIRILGHKYKLLDAIKHKSIVKFIGHIIKQSTITSLVIITKGLKIEPKLKKEILSDILESKKTNKSLMAPYKKIYKTNKVLKVLDKENITSDYIKLIDEITLPSKE